MIVKPHAAEPADPPDREMLVELVGLHARVLRRMPWVQALLMIGLALFVAPHVPTAALVAWSAFTIGVEALRASVAARVLAQGQAADPKRTHARFVVLAAASGGAMGLGAVMFLPQLPVLHEALFGAVLFAMPAAGVAVSQSSRYIVAAYALSMLVPATATWVHLHPEHTVALGGLTLLYCGLIITVAADGDQLLLRSVVIRHERDRLIRDLEARNAEVRLAMQQAQQSALARARVLAAASHDLRQPLHALSVYSAVLAANPAPAVLREVGTNMDQIVRSLGSLLHGLLDLSRLAAGDVVAERQPFVLDALLAPACAETRLLAERKGLAFEARLEPIRLEGDAVAVTRIVRNLLDNAVKYTDRGHIRVTAGRDADAGSSTGPAAAAVIRVADTGRGIAADERPRIFEEFYQVGNPGRDRSQGVGLGLAIVQRLCALIGATIEVESQPGAGTCFCVRLPMAAAAVRDAAGERSAVNDVSLAGRRALLLDDEAHIVQSMSHLLKLWGIHCSSATSPADAETWFDEQGPPDLLIADLRLGTAEHGAALAERLSKRHGEFAVLVITGETGSAALREAREAGFTVLHKPVSAEALRDAVVKVLAPVDA